MKYKDRLADKFKGYSLTSNQVDTTAGTQDINVNYFNRKSKPITIKK